MLAEQSKELNILRNENEELRKEGADYNAQTEKLKHELDNNKAAINALQINNDKLKHALRKEKTTNNSLQVSNIKLLEELNTYKARLRKLQGMYQYAPVYSL